MTRLLAWLRSLVRRRPVEAPSWTPHGDTGVWSRTMSGQELADDDLERLARLRAARRPPEWLARRPR